MYQSTLNSTQTLIALRLSFLTLLFLFTIQPVFSQNWTFADYKRYDTQTFLKLPQINQPIDFKNMDRPLLHAAMFYVTNQERIKYGLKPFKHLDRMEKVAADHASDMVNYNFYSHVSRVKGKSTIVDRFKLEGLNLMSIAENISSSHALQYQNGRKVNPPRSGLFTYASAKREVIVPHTYLSYAREVVRLWMESPSHRKSILNPHHEYLGCGAMVYGEKSFYNMPYFMGVQCFGSGK
jgi:uncharacterized protein YkwD